ncbi:MAG: glycosyltransferase family 9 protein [Candidatus Andersenbacteria bacterium]|nr:glycosyltransferase family 9 protein [Candidatus Andersenbacteria bacterium]
MKKILLKHVGNMGDLVFFALPVIETLKRTYPESHMTFVTAWGLKQRRRSPIPPFNKYDFWGNRNFNGYCISLLAANPRIDKLVHWHDTALSLEGTICQEEGKSYSTWSKAYYEKQKGSGAYDIVAELDIGVSHTENPLGRMYQQVGLPKETYSNYHIDLTPHDLAVAQEVTKAWPKPCVLLIEGLAGTTTRGWDGGKVAALEKSIQKKYASKPIWFGSKHIPMYQGRSLTLRENIATLTYADAGIGVLSGPLHFAAAVGLPTITLYADQPLHRAAPAYFLNQYIANNKKKHRTLIGPSPNSTQFLKHDQPSQNLTPQEASAQHHQSWLNPGNQPTKTPLAAITVDEVLLVLADILG